MRELERKRITEMAEKGLWDYIEGREKMLTAKMVKTINRGYRVEDLTLICNDDEEVGCEVIVGESPEQDVVLIHAPQDLQRLIVKFPIMPHILFLRRMWRKVNPYTMPILSEIDRIKL